MDIDHTMFTEGGILADWQNDSNGGQPGAHVFRGPIFYESTKNPFLTFNTKGGPTEYYELDNVVMADAIGSDVLARGTMIKVKEDNSTCAGCTLHGTLGSGFIVNVQPDYTLFNIEPGKHLQDGVSIFNLDGNKYLGLLGSNRSYNLFNSKSTGAIFDTSFGNTLALGVGGGLGVGMASPQTPACTGSPSGGTLAAGDYYLFVTWEGTGYDGTTKEGFGSDEIGPITLTGSTSSIGCTTVAPPAGWNTAVRYHVGTGHSLGESVYYRSTNLTSYTITGAGAVSNPVPSALHPATTNLALDHMLTSIGWDSWLAINTNLCIGLATTTCPKKLYVNGTFGVSGVSTFTGAANFDSITVNSCDGCIPPTQVANDDFNRANGGLGTNWTTPSGFQTLNISSNAVQATGAGHNVAYYNAVAWPADHYSEVTVTANASASDYVGLAVRMNSAGDGYVFAACGPAAGACTAVLNKMAGGGFAANLGTASVTTHVGDVFRFKAIGTTLSVTQNGAPILSVTDASYASGNAGIDVFNSSGTFANARVDSWAGGNQNGGGSSVTSVNGRRCCRTGFGHDGWPHVLRRCWVE